MARIKSTRTKEQKAMAVSYSNWKFTLTVEVLFTADEYIKLWDDSGKWKHRGIRAGDYQITILDITKPVTIDNVAILMRMEHVAVKTKRPSTYKRTKTKDQNVEEFAHTKKFKDPAMQQKYELAVQTKRSRYRGIDLIKLGVRKSDYSKFTS